ncbi:formate--tetrahydrofolate ligase [Pseudonocardia sp. N23]|uniref:formate--tetrahydrofolate ligase n=1 Tax=Pseudonocardia sp. N23 TaxID=1987376 RepID=UPI00209C1B26
MVSAVTPTPLGEGKTRIVAGKALPEALLAENPDEVHEGGANLRKQIENIRVHGVTPVVAINAFPDDHPSGHTAIAEIAASLGVRRRRHRPGGREATGRLRARRVRRPAGLHREDHLSISSDSAFMAAHRTPGEAAARSHAADVPLATAEAAAEVAGIAAPLVESGNRNLRADAATAVFLAAAAAASAATMVVENLAGDPADPRPARGARAVAMSRAHAAAALAAFPMVEGG